MADVPKLTTPITNRNIIQQSKESRNAGDVQFEFQDISKVNKPSQGSDMHGQNNVLREDGSEAGFYEILHDPDVSSSFLKSIFLLREIVDILPMNNSTQTEEINELMNNLMLNPEEITGEMMKQEDISTIFKGGLFDMLRNLTEDAPTALPGQSEALSETESAVAGLLKAINNESSKGQIFGSLMNNIETIAQSVSASPKLSEAFKELTEELDKFFEDTEGLKNTEGQESRFLALKNSVLKTFGEMQQSILYSDDIDKAVSLATYNMSRISLAENSVTEAFAKLLGLIENDEDKENLTNSLLKFLDDAEHTNESKIMNTLTEILQKQSENPDLKMLNSDSMGKIIQSLLSSPCNFTPLLHYVVPVEYEDMQATAEMWINPDGQEDVEGGSDEKCTHILAVFEIQDIGKFETELFATGKKLDLQIKCPAEYTDFYKKSLSNLKKDLNFSVYKLGNIEISTLDKPRSLIEVFKSLPQRRTGVNVTI